MTAALPSEAAGKPVEVWFTDEARVGQQGTLTRVWAKRGSRPRAPRDRRYEWAYLFGAICPERRTGAAIIMPEVNIEAMNEHLGEISRRVSVGAIALLVLDGAGWHSSPRLKVPDNIVLLPLPPYSPELNPMENVWEFLRGNCSAIAYGKLTKPFSMLAKTPGTGSCARPSASLRSLRAPGQNRSPNRPAGIIPTRVVADSNVIGSGSWASDSVSV
jgi:DDE superfamily endonuclease